MSKVLIRQSIQEISFTPSTELVGTETYNVPVDPRINITELTAGDDNPMFVNVEVIRSGISKANRREYNNDVVREIARMIPGVQGFLGHPDPSKHGFEFREPHCIFVGAEVQEMGGGAVRALSKAYLMPSSPLREWVPKSIAAGKPMTVSINALGDIIKDITNQLIRVKKITELQSIDWANPGTEGFATSTASSIVSEMQNKGGEKMDVKEVLQNVTIAEMQSANPQLIANVIANVSIEELQKANPKVVQSIEAGAKITELALKINGEDKKIPLADVQTVIDAKDAKIVELQGEISQGKLTEFKSNKINELVPENYREAVGKRVTGDTEDAITTSITNELAYITELAGSSAEFVKPVGNTQRQIDNDMAKQVQNLFGVKTEK